jgi:glycosyltransferase involved in cell wall biosynthesis
MMVNLLDDGHGSGGESGRQSRKLIKKIALVYPGSNFDTIPSIYNSVILLTQQGYQVDILTAKTGICHHKQTFGQSFKVKGVFNSFLPSISDQVQVVMVKNPYTLVKYSCIFLRKLVIFLTIITEIARPHVLLFRAVLNRDDFDYICAIGVDPGGLFAVQGLSQALGFPVIYYSLELFLSEELTSAYDVYLKRKEIEHSRKSAFIIIQDSYRAKLLAEDNKIPADHFVFVPNSPLGSARKKRGTYWHQKFNLTCSQRVVLHSGSIERWTAVEDIIGSVGSWPDDWVLIVHTRYSSGDNPEIAKLQKQATPGKVYFSLDPVPAEEYECLVDSADIGIAFYVSVPGSPFTQKNIITIGFSSGKIAYYLRAGLPVITNNASTIGAFVRDAKCGVSVDSPLEIASSIEELSKNYPQYSHNAIETYDKFLIFNNNFQEVIRRIDNLGE